MLEVTTEDRVVWLRIPHPVELGNSALRLAWELLDACAETETRDERPVAIVLTSGGPAFGIRPPGCAAECDAVAGLWGDATAAVSRLGAPTIAVLGGDALGPAWELALACDLRIAAADVSVGSPEIRWGRMPSAGGTQRLVRLAGIGTALRLLLLEEALPAMDALDLGLLHRVVPATELETALEELLAGFRAAAPLALAYAKEAAVHGADLPLQDGLRLEADLAALLQTTDDQAEGVNAFLERRTARFEGR